MHEEALVRDLHRKLRELSDAAGSASITRVRLRIGALSHLSEGSVRERWAEIVRGTGAAGAQLEIELSRDPDDPRADGLVLVDVGVEDR